MGFRFVMAVEAGMDIRTGSGQDQAVKKVKKLGGRGGRRQARQDQRQAAGHLGHRLGRPVAADLGVERVLDPVAEGGDADEGAAFHHGHSNAFAMVSGLASSARTAPSITPSWSQASRVCRQAASGSTSSGPRPQSRTPPVMKFSPIRWLE